MPTGRSTANKSTVKSGHDKMHAGLLRLWLVERLAQMTFSCMLMDHLHAKRARVPMSAFLNGVSTVGLSDHWLYGSFCIFGVCGPLG